MEEDNDKKKFQEMIDNVRKTKNGDSNIETIYHFLNILMEKGGNMKSDFMNTAFIEIYMNMSNENPIAKYPTYATNILRKYDFLEKRGSNRYPEWNIPVEKRKFIQERLVDYYQFEK